MSSLMRRRPFQGVTRLQDEMNELFDQFFGGPVSEAQTMNVATDVAETNDNIIVTVEAPGVDPKHMDISIQENTLTITGEKKQETDNKDERLHRVERSYGKFTRSFQLPAAVIVDKVSADYDKGVLRITLPKSSESKRREVKIKVN